jgi:hypothetical protein
MYLYPVQKVVAASRPASSASGALSAGRVSDNANSPPSPMPSRRTQTQGARSGKTLIAANPPVASEVVTVSHRPAVYPVRSARARIPIEAGICARFKTDRRSPALCRG